MSIYEGVDLVFAGQTIQHAHVEGSRLPVSSQQRVWDEFSGSGFACVNPTVTVTKVSGLASLDRRVLLVTTVRQVVPGLSSTYVSECVCHGVSM